ncbi:MAG: GAF domain-containing protein [Aggregatilineales bacterium]
MRVAPTTSITATSNGFLAELTTLGQRLRFGLLVLLAVCTLALSAIYLTEALDWRDKPFLGVMVAHTMNVSAGQSTTDNSWAGHRAGLQTGDRIVSINGENVLPDFGANYIDVLGRLANTPEALGENGQIQAIIGFERAVNSGDVLDETLCSLPESGVSTCEVAYSLTPLPDRDFFAFFVIPFFSGIFVIITAMAIIRLRPAEPVAFIAAITCLALGTGMVGIFDVGSTHLFIPVWLAAAAILTGMFFSIGILFPNPMYFLYREPRMRFIPFVASIGFALYLISLFNAETGDNFNLSVRLATLAIILSVFVMGALLVFYQRVHATDSVTRDQANTVLIGVSLALVPGAVWALAQLITGIGGMMPGFDPNVAFPFSIETTMPFLLTIALSLAYSVLQYRHFDTDRIISQGITYGILALALVVGYFLLVLGATQFITDNFSADDPLIIALVIFTISAGFIPIRTRIQNRVDDIYFKKRRNYQNHLESFTTVLTSLNKTGEILRLFERILNDTIQPASQFTFLLDTQTDSYVPDSKSNTDLSFMADSGVIQLLKGDQQVFCLEPGVPWPSELRVDKARLNILRSTMIIGLGKNETMPIGFKVIGPPRSVAPMYSFEEVRFVNNLAAQVSIGIERAQVIATYEQQVNQLNVLSKVSQAVNFTIEPDDLLELIVTQTERIISAPFFYIVLYEMETKQLHYAFFLENDERDDAKENMRWMAGNDLFSEIITHSRAIKVADYGREMTRQNFPIRYESPDTTAWMGVPLIAGTGTLGVMAIGDSNPNKTFSDAQLQVFSDIGTLAAASLYQARLFTEANVRARQLGALNDISRRLVESEENIEQLLELITSEAVNILNAEAGSLLLIVQDGSGDLEFKASVGGPKDLIGTRLPPGYGIVGEVAEGGEPIISNDISQDTRFEGEVEETFRTNSLLAVPLTAKEGVIGVLEVINKLDGTLYGSDDQELLTTFAGQAAIALENARLFQETDQALKTRVQELEDLQRFSEALSKSLDVRGVAEVTVKEAMKRTTSFAGLLAIVNEDESYLRIVSIHGYEEHQFPEGVFNGDAWELEAGIVKRVMRTRQPDLAPDVAIDPDYLAGLPGALSQITVPLMSGNTINALLVLEKTREPRFNLLDQAAVMRIAEQASIALANALLYEQVASANETKSEFVGFAAHELKNPLTSVKGYAATLTSSMYDQLNPDQVKDFIGIIQNNANRMQSIIDDLRDIARSDAGKFPIDAEPVRLDKIIEDTLIPFQSQLDEKEQTIVNNINEDLPLIMADNNKLIQVLTNFVSNAYKYSPPGATITLDAVVRPRYITSKNKNLGTVMEISVSDTGRGMSADDLKRLFREDYFRSDNAKSEKGTGLGMIITKRIIEGHNGEVWVESEIDEGTRFAFVIPLAPRDPQQTQQIPMIEHGTD